MKIFKITAVIAAGAVLASSALASGGKADFRSHGVGSIRAYSWNTMEVTGNGSLWIFARQASIIDVKGFTHIASDGPKWHLYEGSGTIKMTALDHVVATWSAEGQFMVSICGKGEAFFTGKGSFTADGAKGNWNPTIEQHIYFGPGW
jgi:hypothetical protein